MKLITETNMQAINRIDEEVDEHGKKSLFINGIFCQAETKNRNGRIYKKSVLKHAVDEYIEEFVKERRSMGELNHPNQFAVNPERACILVKELHWDENNVLGKAKVLSTSKGELVRNLINDGVQLGVSSRGIGTLKNIDGIAYVQDDYKIGAIDVVSNPSGPSCWVDGILENIEYYYDNGILQESTVEEFLKHKKTYDMKSIQEDLNTFMKKIII